MSSVVTSGAVCLDRKTILDWIDLLAFLQNKLMVADIGQCSIALCADAWDVPENVEEEGKALGMGTYINCNFELCQTLLRFFHIENQTAQTIRTKLNEALGDIPHHQFVSVTTDNAASMRAAREGGFVWVGCSAHTIHLGFEHSRILSATPSVASVWEKVNHICVYFGPSGDGSSELESCLNSRRKKPKKIQRPVPHRW